MNNEPVRVTVTNPYDGQELILELPQDSTINDWIKVFKTIMVFQTFTENQVKELFGDRQWEYPCEASDEEEDEDDKCLPYKPCCNTEAQEKKSKWKYPVPEESFGYHPAHSE